MAHFREALRLQPDWSEALNRLAWALLIDPDPKKRDGKEALQLASRACELTRHQDPSTLNALAAAYAELGQFAEAIQISDQAIALAKTAGYTGLVDYITTLQKLYKENRRCYDLKE